MFCSTLRKRDPWAAIVTEFSKTRGPGWEGSLTVQSGLGKEAATRLINTIECPLVSHDVAIPLPRLDSHADAFRLVLLSTLELAAPEAEERIERLSLLGGGNRRAIVLLLTGDDSGAAFARLQLRMFSGACLPIIPITSLTELIPTLEKLRQAVADSSHHRPHLSLQVRNQHLLSHCVRGPPLTGTQVNYLTDVFANMGDLAANASDPHGQQLLCDFLGDKDGSRVISFFTQGPAPID
ncbi:hypothetical protein HJFPF1_01489 [Paramyrothecium foliicola]|nr:hypothetical protein HJFPF1_01489 [Paramyrothecium foliicola]